MSNSYDLVVIGGGPGGYVAAARASSLGLKTAIVEKDKQLGGTCLHRGCIPTKTLLHAADVYQGMKEAPKLGIKTEGVHVDWKQVQKYKSRIISTNAGGINHLMKSRNVDVYTGFGKLVGKTDILVESENGDSVKLEAKNVLLAVGSKPRELPFAPYSNERILNSDSVLELDSIPGSLTIIGGGVIGIEFASIFVRFGTKVTVLEALPRILEPADADCSTELVLQLEKQGVKFHTDVRVESVTDIDDGVKTSFVNSDDQALVQESEYVVVAVGRAPLTQDIGLLENQIQTEKGFVVINEWMQTTSPDVYAIGDCVDTPLLAHVSSAEGILAVEHMAHHETTPINYDHTPSCVYSDPPVAWSGLTEKEAIARGHNIKIGRFDFVRNAKAAILGKKRGFVKFVTDAQYGEILGVHIIGPEATDLLAEPAFAMQMEATIKDIAHTVHAHPTLYESIYEAARVAAGEAIHG